MLAGKGHGYLRKLALPKVWDSFTWVINSGHLYSLAMVTNVNHNFLGNNSTALHHNPFNIKNRNWVKPEMQEVAMISQKDQLLWKDDPSMNL